MVESSPGRLVVIVGATATGKSRLAMRLATKFSGEIISADSRQVYRFMDIGTAKPSSNDRKAIPHHIIDVIEPDSAFGLSQFKALFNKAYQNAKTTGSLPFLVGGTGQYVWAVLEGWQVPQVPPDKDLRRRLEAMVDESGIESVIEILMSIDREASRTVDRLNPRRVIRAIEIANYRKKNPGPRKIEPGYDSLIIGLRMDRSRLYARIDDRVEEMMATGWLDEVRNLLARGYDSSLSSMSGVGYRELSAHLRGDLSLEEAVSKAKYRTHRYARQQHAWFKADDPRIHWLDAEGEMDLADGILQEWLDRIS
ncbi:MAG: tRNA (adenosine(37)-N6)-dimethylallyltransferase MiaA [SAR202 cluster bacterium]|nr:tRNA (adenosine(37)-N6)-dimethylallyltransferase MiaA [SAR202 cluster bacterium]